MPSQVGAYGRRKNSGAKPAKSRAHHVTPVAHKMDNLCFGHCGKYEIGGVAFVGHLENDTRKITGTPDVQCVLDNRGSNHPRKMVPIRRLEQTSRPLKVG